MMTLRTQVLNRKFGSIGCDILYTQLHTPGGCRSELSTGIALYYAQLAMNVLWTPLFFVRKQVHVYRAYFRHAC